MAKKGILLLALVLIVTGGAFAQISAGGGVNLRVNFDSTEYGSVSYSDNQTGFGFFGFFDATYVEADVGMVFDGGDIYDITYFTLGAFGKYPIDLGSFTLFPMLGIQYDITMSTKVLGFKVTGYDANRFWIKLGVGADIGITDSIYIRPSFLYGINFGPGGSDAAADSEFHHGLDIRAAVGFKF